MKHIKKTAAASVLAMAATFSQGAQANDDMMCSVVDANTGEFTQVDCPSGDAGDNNNSNTNGNYNDNTANGGAGGDGGDATSDASATGGSADAQGGSVNFANNSTYQGAAAVGLPGLSVGYASARAAKNACEDKGWSFSLGGGVVTDGYGAFGFGKDGDQLVDLTVKALDDEGEPMKDAAGNQIYVTYTTEKLADIANSDGGEFALGKIFSRLGGDERSKGLCLVNEYNEHAQNLQQQRKLKSADLKASLATETIRQNGAANKAHIDGYYSVEQERVKQQGETIRKGLGHLCNQDIALQDKIVYEPYVSTTLKLDGNGEPIPVDNFDPANPEYKKDEVIIQRPVTNLDGDVQSIKVPVADTVASHKRSIDGTLPSGRPAVSEHGGCAKAVDTLLNDLTDRSKSTQAAPIAPQPITVDFDLGL